jgi:hypothetical protein
LGDRRARPAAPQARGDDEEVKAILIATSPSIGFYAAAIALAIAAPRIAAVGYLLIAVVGIMRARGDEVIADPA